MSGDGKPLPRVTPDNGPFWEAARRHELRLQRCLDCGRMWYPPGPVCPGCLSDRHEWAPMSGRGTVSSF
ncbi:MAG: zinc ribbon domain-containing protein, partial [Dehalococcoidia bacterium]|nr:zinc ribbon domain-containing protein [Dehalococcoidia bacterium]